MLGVLKVKERVLAVFVLLLWGFGGSAFGGIATCPGSMVGDSIVGSVVYSDCGFTGPVYLGMGRVPGPLNVALDVAPGNVLVPSPSGFVDKGAVSSTYFVPLDMGTSYSGDCSEVAYTPGGPLSGPASVDSHVYCGRMQGANGSIYIRATWNDTGSEFSAPSVVHEVQSQAVPSMSIYGLVILAGLLGLLGMRQRINW